MQMLTFSDKDLLGAALHIDAKYQGGRCGNAGDCPLTKLLGVSNQGGFRYLGSKEKPRLIVLTTNLSDPEWPDELDAETGILTYFGDNKKPGRDLHGTPRFGNLLLRNIFNAMHLKERTRVPPILVFSGSGTWRDMIFRGLAVPGASGLSQFEDLVAVWKLSRGSRFQNYRAKFTILNVASLSRAWLSDIQQGHISSTNAPKNWLKWIDSGHYLPLLAPRNLEIRGKNEQIPTDSSERDMLSMVYEYFKNDPICFEACAAEIARMGLGKVVSIDLTRPTRDGGRDAIGQLQIGDGLSSIVVDFSIEAKCYLSSSSVGVRECSRLISRIRHRQFGVMVTTSWVHSQAYKEIREDGHPIIIISGVDIIHILKTNGITCLEEVSAWLLTNFMATTPVPLNS